MTPSQILLAIAVGCFLVALCLFQGWFFDDGNAWSWMAGGSALFAGGHLVR